MRSTFVSAGSCVWTAIVGVGAGLWAGSSASAQEDCLRWEMIQAVSPPNAGSPALAVYDSVRSRLVALDYTARAFEWDGTTWSAIADALPVLTCLGEPCSIEGTPCTIGNQSSICIRDSLWLNSPILRGAMGFDRRRGVTVAYDVNGALREWDGRVWTKKSPLPSPGFRAGATLTWDPIRQVLILFGGLIPSVGTSNEMWEWDGIAWTFVPADTSPPARFLHGKAFDEARGVLVVYGGRSSITNPIVFYNDIWEWDGTDWEERVPDNKTLSPAPHSRHAMDYDSRRHVTVVTGGTSPTAALDETWEWDGRIWRQRAPTNSPGATVLQNRTLVYDAGRDMLHAINTSPFHLVLRYDAPPEVSKGPASLTVTEGDPAAFGVTTEPMIGVEYQWRRNGVPIVGATFPGYGIAAVAPGDQGVYDVAVSRSGHDPFPACGVTVSGPASLIVHPAIPADLNGDGVVDLLDFAEFETAFNGPMP